MKFLNRFKRKATETDPPATPPESKPASSTTTAEAKQPYPTKKAPPNPDELRFELGDFLHRIPTHLLQSGPHDLKTELCFEIKELSDRIARGQTTISISEIYKRVPQIFREQILDSDNIEVRFPWQKLARLVNSVRVDSKNDISIDSAADVLAEKLRQKKTTASEFSNQTNQLGPSVLPGIGGNQSAWFSKPTFDRPTEKALPPTKPAPTSAPASAPTSAPTSTPPEPAPLELKLATTETVVAQTPKPSEEDLQIADLPADLARRVAVIKGDYERQLSELEKQRKLATEARERQVEETERLRIELEQARAHLASEVTASTVTRELLEKSSSERQLVQDELNARLRELDEIQAQIANLKDESKVAALTNERDALLQQKAYLSSQVAEVSKRGHSTKTNEVGSGVSMGAQRQVEEFQRRIGTLEASQRENALIIAREKELRAKAEKLLTAAEKLQEQSANHMESAKTEMRKEIEVSFRQRENEARKAQKELQDQITALSDQARIAAVELENARAHTTELQEQLVAARAAATPQPDPLQAQLVIQLESDIENYRERLKILIRERDEARSENVEGASSAEVEKLISEKLKIESELNEVRKLQQEQAAAMALLQEQRANDQQRAEQERAIHEERASSLLQSIESAQQSLSEKRASLEPVLAETKAELEALRAQNNDITGKLQSEREQFEQERQQATASLREQSLALEQQLANLVKERDQLRHDKDALSARIKSEAEAREDLITGLDREHTSVVRANEELTRRLAETERALHEIENERERFTNADSAMLGDPALQSEVAALQTQLANATAERDEARLAAKARNDALHESETTLNRLAAEHQQVVADISEEKAAKNRIQTDLEALQGELTALRMNRETADSSEKEKLTAQLSEECEKSSQLNKQVNSIEAELAAIRKQHEDIVRAHESAVLEKQKLAATLTEIERSSHAAHSELAAERDSITSALKVARDEYEKTATALDAERQSGECAKKEADIEITRLRDELTAAEKAFADLQRTTADEIAAISKSKIAFEEQSRVEIESLSRTAKEIQTAAETAHEAKRSAEETIAAMESKLSADTSKLTQELDGLRRSTELATDELAESRKAQQESAALLEDTQRQLSEIRGASELQEVEFDKLRAALAAARHDYDELAQRAAIEKSSLRQQLDALSANLASERESARNSSALSENLKHVTEDLAKARHDLASIQSERDTLTRRLEQTTEELSAAQAVRESEPAHSMRTHSSTPPVIEVFEPEVVFPVRENGIAIPRIRPVPIAPPKVGSH